MGKAVDSKVTTEREALAAAMAAIIRQRSEAGHLVSENELCQELAQQHLPASSTDLKVEARAMLVKALVESEDLQELVADDDTRSYYSSQTMTQTYALILLGKQGEKARLIAQIVRQNSAAYPRPVPLDIFTHPPFDLTRQEVIECLERMAAEGEYRDIASTTTSASGIFLYSTLHLEPDHASMLAEWLDVGQFDNP